MELGCVAWSWGSPVGLGLFLMLSGVGAASFFWGISKLPRKRDGE